MKISVKGLVGLAGVLCLAAPSSGSAAEWETARPEATGFSAELGADLDAALALPDFQGVHAVLVVRDGKLVYERYLTGDDEIWGRPKPGVVFGPEMLHDVRSITKSVVGLLYGIALDRGLVPELDDPVVASFSEYPELMADEARRRISMRHVLSMTMGLEWDEMNVPYGNPANSETAMNDAPDSLLYALDRPIALEPGDRWIYSGGAAELAGEIIARGSGTGLAQYADENLFAPLGITRFEWITDYYGRPHAASSLRLRPRDTARIGQMVLDGGAWEGQQVVPADWLALSTEPRAEAMSGCQYGYFWWLCNTESGYRIVEGAGWGGQELLILPELKLVMVVNAGFYGDSEGYTRAFRLLEEIVIPSTVATPSKSLN